MGNATRSNLVNVPDLARVVGGEAFPSHHFPPGNTCVGIRCGQAATRLKIKRPSIKRATVEFRANAADCYITELEIITQQVAQNTVARRRGQSVQCVVIHTKRCDIVAGTINNKFLIAVPRPRPCRNWLHITDAGRGVEIQILTGVRDFKLQRNPVTAGYRIVAIGKTNARTILGLNFL